MDPLIQRIKNKKRYFVKFNVNMLTKIFYQILYQIYYQF